MKHFAVFTAYMGVMSMMVMPLMAQSYNIPFVPRVVAGGCGQSFVTTNITGWITFGHSVCTTPLDAYSMHATKEAPSGTPALSRSADGTSTVLIDTQSSRTTTDQPECGLSLFSANQTLEYFEMHETVLDVDPADFSLGVVLRNNSTTTPSGIPTIVQARHNGGNIIAIRHPDGDNIQCRLEMGDAQILLSTASDTSCCPGFGGCDSLFASGEYARDKWIMVECRGENTGGTDNFQLWVDGCLVNSSTATQSTAVWSNAKHRWGMILSNDDLDESIAFIGWDKYGYDWMDTISGGDDDLSDGDECWNFDD